MSCPACGSVELVLLGVLGSVVWFRCRYCGAEQHQFIDRTGPIDE